MKLNFIEHYKEKASETIIQGLRSRTFKYSSATLPTWATKCIFYSGNAAAIEQLQQTNISDVAIPEAEIISGISVRDIPNHITHQADIIRYIALFNLIA